MQCFFHSLAVNDVDVVSQDSCGLARTVVDGFSEGSHPSNLAGQADDPELQVERPVLENWVVVVYTDARAVALTPFLTTASSYTRGWAHPHSRLRRRLLPRAGLRLS